MSRLVHTTLIVISGQAKRRRCAVCNRRIGVLRGLFLEHFTRSGSRCTNSGQPAQ